MLNVNEIAARIENPSITRAQDSEDLKLLAEKYPYTQMFSILYLQSLKQAGDVHFEDELKKHSFRITDRAQLFNLIESAHSISAEPTPVIDAEGEVEEIIETTEEESQDSASFHQAHSDAINHLKEKEEVPTSNEILEPKSELEKEESDSNRIVSQDIVEAAAEMKEGITSEEHAEEIETPTLEEEPIHLDEPASHVDDPQIEVEETTFDSDSPDLVVEDEPIEIEDREIEVEETIWGPDISEKEPEKEELYSVKEAFKDEPEVREKSKDQLEQTIEHHIYAANYQLDSLSPEEEERLKEKQAQPQKETTAEPEKTEIKEDLSFTSWLQANDNYVEPEEEVVEAKVVPEFSGFDPSNPLFGEQERPKKEFFSAPKKAKKSLTEETVPVSETLAKVYAMQGNYPKAIAAYEQLMLTIPEKKSFFVSLIEDLKTKLNT